LRLVCDFVIISAYLLNCSGVTAIMSFDSGNIKHKLKSLFEVKDLTEEFDCNDIRRNRGMAMLSALPITFWIPVVRHSTSPFVLFHANNGLLLLISYVAASVAALICRFIPFGWIISFPLWGFLAVETVFSSLEALSGNARQLRLIGKLGLKLIRK